MSGAVCMRCGKRYRRRLDDPCALCGPEGVLDIEFDLRAARRAINPRTLVRRPRDQWRYRELLPLPSRARVAPLHVGWTPIEDAPRLADWAGLRALRLKDEGRNPTASFKDRASGVGVARALGRKARVVACASTGNAASSLAGAAASVGLTSVIFVPDFAPEPKVAQLLVFGARVIRVKGTYDETWEMCQRACDTYGWYNRNAAVNPSLVEGKKTCGLEIAEQLGSEVPDWVAVSVGDGCTIAGTWKGLREMHALGFIRRLPRMLGVQAEGARPLVDAFRTGGDLVPSPAQTLADSICVGHPRNWRKALRAVRESGAGLVRRVTGLDEAMDGAGLAVTGEGRFDWQSLRGKVVTAVAAAAVQHGVPCVLLAGQVAVGRREAAAIGVDAAYAVAEHTGSLDAAFADPAGTLAGLAEHVARQWGGQ